MATSPGVQNPRLAWGALGVVYVLWGSTYLGNRLIITDVPPLFSGGVRFLTGGALLALVVVLVAGRAALRMTRAQLATTALSGVLLPGVGQRDRDARAAAGVLRGPR